MLWLVFKVKSPSHIKHFLGMKELKGKPSWTYIYIFLQNMLTVE